MYGAASQAGLKGMSVRDTKLIGRFFVADPGLQDDRGHHFATSLELAQGAAARGMQPQILAAAAYAGKGAAKRVFNRSLYQPRVQVRFPLEGTRRSGPLTDQNSVDMLMLAAQSNVTRSDIFMFHTVTIDFLASLMDYFVLTPRDRLATHHFVFRYDPASDEWGGGEATLVETVRRLQALDLLGSRIFLYAETDALAHVYRELSGAPVHVLYHFSVSAPDTARPTHEGPVRVGFFGEARIEKGIDAFHHAVEAVMDRLDGRARFVTQCYSASMNKISAIEAAHAFFWGPRYSARHEVLAVLGDAEYGRELTAAEVLVVAHRTPRYARRGSGIFVDGIVHGKVMVLRAGTWMSAICPEELAVTFTHDHELPDAIERAVKLAESRRRSPSPPNVARALFDVGANLQEVLRTHMSAMTAPLAPRRLRVLHIAPFWIRQGSTRVYEAQLRALAELGATVMCVHIANFPVKPDPDEATYRWFLDQAPATGAVHQWLVATVPEADSHGKAVVDRLTGKPYSWMHEWAQAQSFEIPASLASFAQNADIDLVVLNYAHNLPLVLRLGLSGKPLIVETHDIRARQFASLGRPEDAVRDEAAEFTALRAASGVVFINREEAEATAVETADKPTITVLPSLPLPLDRTWAGMLRSGHAAQRWAVLRSLADRLGPPDRDRDGLCEFYVALRQAGDRPEDLVCFLGSSHRWNMVSLDWFHDEVFAPHLLRRGLRLVVAGRAAAEFTAARGRVPGVIALGEIDDVAFLYESGIAFALPVRGGTGFPIKTLEALTAGSPVVGTSQAFRGFPDLAGVAAVEDEPRGFAQALLALASPGSVKGGCAAKAPLLSWEYYRSEWARLIEQVSGRRLPIPVPLPASRRGNAETLAAVAPLSPLIIEEAWICTAETQPAFLTASIGFKPSPSETDFCWSAENAMAIELAVEGPARALEFVIPAVTPPAEGVATQEVVVFRDGAYVGRVQVTGDSALELPLGPEAVGPGPHRVTIEFVVPRARYGLEFSGWKDMRRLGIAISAIRVLR